MFVSCEYCVLSGTGLCDGLIARREECYRLCCVIECDLETSELRRLRLVKDCNTRKKKNSSSSSDGGVNSSGTSSAGGGGSSSMKGSSRRTEGEDGPIFSLPQKSCW